MRRKNSLIPVILALSIFVFVLPSFAQNEEAVFGEQILDLSADDFIRLNQSLKKLIDENRELLLQSEALQQKFDDLRSNNAGQENQLRTLAAEKTTAQKKIKDLVRAVEMLKNAQVDSQKNAQSLRASSTAMGEIAQMFSQLVEENEMIRSQTAKTHHALAYLLLEEGRRADAAAEFARVVDLLPRDAAAHYNLALICEEYLKDYKTAAEHYRKYLELAPDAGDAAAVRSKISQLESVEESRIDIDVSGKNGGRNDK